MMINIRIYGDLGTQKSPTVQNGASSVASQERRRKPQERK